MIWKLYVRPEAQGTGVGGALMDALLEALPPDRDTVTIEYMDDNDRTAAFYARKGFVVTGRSPDETAGFPHQIWATWVRRYSAPGRNPGSRHWPWWVAVSNGRCW